MNEGKITRTKRVKMELFRQFFLEKLPPRPACNFPHELTGNSSDIFVNQHQSLLRLFPTVKTEKELIRNSIGVTGTTLIYGDAGVGKSHLMFELARNLFKNVSDDVAIFPTINQWCSLLSDNYSKLTSWKKIVHQIGEKMFEDVKTRKQFWSLVGVPRDITFHVFLDGFDLIPTPFKNALLEILKLLVVSRYSARIWISCGGDMVNTISKVLTPSQSIRLNPLSQSDCFSAIHQCLAAKGHEMDENRVKVIARNLSATLGESSYIHHIIMVADLIECYVTNESNRLPLHTDTWSLLKAWIRYKYKVALSNTPKLDIGLFVCVHAHIAFKQFFPLLPIRFLQHDLWHNSDVLIQFGLINENDKTQLKNTSVAEWLVAWFTYILFSVDPKKDSKLLPSILMEVFKLDVQNEGFEFRHCLIVHCLNSFLERESIWKVENNVETQVISVWDQSLITINPCGLHWFACGCAYADYYHLFKAFLERFILVVPKYKNVFTAEWLVIAVGAARLEFVKLAVKLWKGVGNFPSPENIPVLKVMFDTAARRDNAGILSYLYDPATGFGEVVADIARNEGTPEGGAPDATIVGDVATLPNGRVPACIVPGPGPVGYQSQKCVICLANFNYGRKRKTMDSCGCSKCQDCVARSEKGCTNCHQEMYTEQELDTFITPILQLHFRNLK